MNNNTEELVIEIYDRATELFDADGKTFAEFLRFLRKTLSSQIDIERENVRALKGNNCDDLTS